MPLDINRIHGELEAWSQAHGGQNPIDPVRREKINAVVALTGRPLIIYAADFLTAKALNPQVQGQTNIGLRDKDFFADIIRNIPGDSVDLLIQSPGGFAEVTEAIVAILRTKFRHVRAIVPGAAKSAATMLAMSADQILMDSFSELGPTDPQMAVNGRFSPAGSILKQFDLAQKSLKADPSAMAVWLPMLQMFGPSLLVECRHHLDLSRALVGSWLQQYMFAGHPDADAIATDIATWLAEDDNFHTHGRRVSVDQLQERQVNVINLDDAENAALQNAIQELYLMIMTTFDRTGSFKIVENSVGDLLSQGIQVQIPQIMQFPFPGLPVAPPQQMGPPPP